MNIYATQVNDCSHPSDYTTGNSFLKDLNFAVTSKDKFWKKLIAWQNYSNRQSWAYDNVSLN